MKSVNSKVVSLIVFAVSISLSNVNTSNLFKTNRLRNNKIEIKKREEDEKSFQLISPQVGQWKEVDVEEQAKAGQTESH